MKLIEMRLRNFKGVRDFTLTPNGDDVAVWGDNATGKTTLFDAFDWLLFDKDSLGRKDFEVKTLGPDGQPLHGLEHEVAAVLEYDYTVASRTGETAISRHIELRKVYREKWTKKRGSATAEFTGNTCEYHVDGVPVKEAEYKATVAAIADEATFALLTDPLQFPERLHWQKRREILLAVCGDLSDADVIASDRELADLPAILGNRKLDDQRKVVAARRAEINKDLDRIPVRIDEVSRSLPAVGDDRAAIDAQLIAQRRERSEAEAERVQIRAGGQVAAKEKRMREIDGAMRDVQIRLAQATDAAVAKDRGLLADLERSADAKGREHRSAQAAVDDTRRQVARLEQRMAGLREEWGRIDAETFVDAQAEACPACGQSLPTEWVEAARSKALAAFNARKADRLGEIQAEGKRLKSEATELRRQANENEATAATLAEDAARFESDAVAVQARISARQTATPDASTDPGHRALATEKAQIESEIVALRQGTASAEEAVAARIHDLDGQVAASEADLSRLAQRDAGLARIEQLKDDERRLAAEFERLERETFLMERFTRAKVRLLEDRINSRFAVARFRLFSGQVNGALAECCDVTCGGVPYGSLNHGARVQVGMDIIRTLQVHYGIEAPVWVDNRESVTSLPEMGCQVVSLVVSAGDKPLRVEAARVKEAV